MANNKGGVGKTTTAVSLAGARAEVGDRVLVVDLDPQASATFSLGIDPEDHPDHVGPVLAGQSHVPTSTLIQRTEEGIDLLPASMNMAHEREWAARPDRDRVIEKLLDQVRADYHLIVIDCPPGMGIATMGALVAADGVVIPLQCETLSHRGVSQFFAAIHDVRKWANPSLAVEGIVPCMCDERTLHARAVLADLEPRYGVRVFAPIPRSVRFAEAPAAGFSIIATAPDSPGAQAYRVIANELVERD